MRKQEYLNIRGQLSFAPKAPLSLLILIGNCGLLAAAIGLFKTEHFLAYIVSQILFAIHFNHSYLILHETCHDSFFKSRKLNSIVGHFASLFAFLPYYSRKLEHNKHHIWTGTFKEASTQNALETFNLNNLKTKKFLGFCFRWWLPIFSLNSHISIWLMGLSPYKENSHLYNNKKDYYKCVCSSLYLIVLYGLFIGFSGLQLMSVLQMLPAIFLYLVLIEFFNLPHHFDASIEERHQPFKFYEQKSSTNTCKPLPFFNQELLLNFNYHLVHHYYPNLPWHELKKANTLVFEASPSGVEEISDFEWHYTRRKKATEVIFSQFIKFSKNQFNNDNRVSTESNKVA